MLKLYIVPEKRLLELLEIEARMAALETGGVDNWEWYGDALCDYREEFKQWNDITDPNYDYEDMAQDELEGFEIYDPEETKK